MIMHNVPHPGKVLEQYMTEDETIADFSVRTGIKFDYLWGIIHKGWSIDIEEAIMLEKALGTSANMWIGMQLAYSRQKMEQEN